MNLVKDTNPGAYAIRVPCVGENHYVLNAKRGIQPPSVMFILAEGYADLDGKAFVDYYCDKCAAEKMKQG